MLSATPALQLFLTLSKTQAVLTRRFDGGLRGLGFSEFLILYQLNDAPGNTLRRIDLAEKIGLTASGVTRLLAPMERTGLVKKQIYAEDARVSFVFLTPAGKKRLSETLDTAELLVEDILPPTKIKKIKEIAEFLTNLRRGVA